MFSKFFIDRPIFATVLAILMILIGLITVKSLPVAQYPDITPPTVMVSAVYPGADAKTVAETVGIPIEEQVNGVEGMMYMSSSSSDGSYMLTITFENGTDLDMATVKVQNRVAVAEPALPSSVQQQGVNVMSRSTNQVLFVAIESDDPGRYDGLYLTNYAKLNIVDELARVNGVGEAQAFGAGDYSMRVWLDPEKMQIRGLTPQDIISAIRSQNIAVSAGNIGAPPADNGNAFQFTLTSQGRLKTPEEFAGITLISNPDGSYLRLGDIATINLGSVDYSNVSRVNGTEAGLIGINQTPGANALSVAKGVEKKLKELEPYFPDGVSYRILMNTTDYVTESIDEVLITFMETTVIVMIVIMLFLQSWRAVIIPMITIPVSLIATFAVMKLFGFTINTLTLFGLVLAIAIVVDDAIVVVEDCERLVQEGKLNSRQAAEKAMVELQGPVVGEVLVLLSVFVPTIFISGITGELYKQFALTIAVSTAFSGFNALTFTPAMCALFLKKRTPSQFFIFRWFNTGWSKINSLYTRSIGRMLQRPLASLCVYIVLCAVAFWGFFKAPTSYIPEEDMGYFLTSVQLPTGASLERTNRIVSQVTDSILSLQNVKDVISISGMSIIGGGNGSNYGSLFVMLKPYSERKGKINSVGDVIGRLNEICAGIQEAVIFSINPPSIPGLGMTSGLQMQLLDINNHGTGQLKIALETLSDAARKDPAIGSVTSLFEGEVQQYKFSINRDKAKLMGLTMANIYSTLSTYMGGTYVNDFVEFDRVYEVKISGNNSSRTSVDDIMKLSVRNNDGKMVPFAGFATIEPVFGTPTVSRYNMYTTASLTASPAHGTSSSQAIDAMEKLVYDTLGGEYSYAWTGEAYQETQSGTTITTVLLFAVIMTILVLAAQYESWTDPLAVVITMPTAILGTILGCYVMSQSVSIYTQIGIILLLGLAAKNAILIVEYAVDFRKAGLDIREAALKAGDIRFRPIMMTALAFVFGVMPMLFATGAGAESRLSLGTAVVFGMAVNAVVGTLFVPNFWELFERFREKYMSKIFASDNPTPIIGNGTGDSESNQI